MGKIAIIDVDTIIIHAALSAQENYVLVKEKNTNFEMQFKTKTEFLGTKTKEGWIDKINREREENGLEPYTVSDFIITQHRRLVSDGSVSAEIVAKGRFNSKIKAIMDQPYFNDYIICFGQGENFRYKAAQTHPYKANRPQKPILYETVRDWMLKKYKNKIVIYDGVETDDIVCYYLHSAWMRAGKDKNKLNVAGVFIDKDLKQVPCYQFNFDKPEKGLVFIDEFEAAKNLCVQMLMGDSADTITGLPCITNELREKYGLRKTNGIGEKTAHAFLEGCNSIHALFYRVAEAYRAFYGDKKRTIKTIHGEDVEWNWIDYMNEQYQLLRMRITMKPVPHISKVLEKLGVEYEEQEALGI